MTSDSDSDVDIDSDWLSEWCKQSGENRDCWDIPGSNLFLYHYLSGPQKGMWSLNVAASGDELTIAYVAGRGELRRLLELVGHKADGKYVQVQTDGISGVEVQHVYQLCHALGNIRHDLIEMLRRANNLEGDKSSGLAIQFAIDIFDKHDPRPDASSEAEDEHA